MITERSQKRRREEEDDGDEEEEIGSKRRAAASHFFELEADVDSDGEGEGEDSEADDDFIDDDDGVDEIDNFVLRRRQVIHPQIGEDEDEEDIDEFERRIEERYGRKSSYEEEEDDTAEVCQQALLPTITDSKLWMVKCAVGHEKEVAACLMQKQIDKNFKLQIRSVIALDHLQNYVYVEADKESHVREACKGMRNIFLKNKIVMVPIKEMSDVLHVKSREPKFSKDSWVRVKTGNYKGDLAQIVYVDDIRGRVTVKLIPRIDFEALINKLDGDKPPKVSKKFCPPPRFWSVTKAEALGIPVRRQKDPATGDFFDTVCGMKFKDGFLYKSLCVKSIGDKVQPTPDDLEKFRGARGGDNDEGTQSIYFSTLLAKSQKKNQFKQGDRVVILNGELKTIQGWVLKVDDDVVYLKPDTEGLPESVAIHSRDLSKLFEIGDHVKVVSGGKEGESGTITSVRGHVVTVLSDKSMNTFDVLADHVQESSEVAYCRDSLRSVLSINNFKPPPRKKGYGSERVYHNNKSSYGGARSVSAAYFIPPTQKKGYGFGRVRRDPLLNARVKIRQGHYNGMAGRVVEVRGNKIRVELEAQMNYAYVDRSQIYENVEVGKSIREDEQYGLGSETPMHCPRTPLGPWMIPTTNSPATPIHEGMRTPIRSQAWSP